MKEAKTLGGCALSMTISNTVFRDNIRDNRLIPVTDGILRIVDTAAFQRLRSIRQMGLGSILLRAGICTGKYRSIHEAAYRLRSLWTDGA